MKILETIFKDHNGSAFSMEHNGWLEEYEKYNVPKEKEKQWIQELQNSYMQSLRERNDWSAFYPLIGTIKNHNTINTLIELFKVCKMKAYMLNDYYKDIVANGWFDILECYNNEKRAAIMPFLNLVKYACQIPFDEIKEFTLLLYKEIDASKAIQYYVDNNLPLYGLTEEDLIDKNNSQKEKLSKLKQLQEQPRI
jgi:hypothetical protein